MTKFTFGLAASAAVGLSLSLSAATSTCISTSDKTWTDGTCWSGGIAPNTDYQTASAGAADTDYIIANGATMRPSEKHWAAIKFGGKSLQLGASDFSGIGSLMLKGNYSWTQVDDLRLYKGDAAEQLGRAKAAYYGA